MKKIFILGALVSALFITGCFNSGPCLQGYGPVTNEVRGLVDFTAVSNTFEYEVRVTQSDTFGVELEAQENLLKLIETYVSGSTLIVKTKNGSCINSSVPVVVYVSMPYIEEMKNTGSGKLYVSASYPDDIEVSQTGSGLVDAGLIDRPLEVSINHTGSGKIFASIIDGLEVSTRMTGSGLIMLDGHAETAELSLSSSGKIDALEMEVADAIAKSTGSGKIFVYARETLDVTITGSGDVYYRGNPLLSTRITGSGSVRPY